MVRKMSKQQRRRLEGMSMIGRDIRGRDKRGGLWAPGGVVDEVYVMFHDYKFMIQRIEFSRGKSWDRSRFGYRTGYYTYDKDMRRIKWGQFAQTLTERWFRRLLSKAKKKGWNLFS